MTDLLSPETDVVDTAERPAVADRPEHPGWASIPDEPEADEVIVRRNGRISVVLAGVSALLSAAYFARAVTELDHVLDWVLCVALAGLTWAHVFSFLDSRMPLLVADSHGVRIRLGRTWRGMAWTDLEEVEYAPRRHVVRDGRLVLFPRELEGELAMLGPAGRRHARLTDRMLGAPFAMPLGLTTRVLGAGGDLSGALAHLADGRCEIVEVVPGADDEEALASADLSDYFEEDGDLDDGVDHGRSSTSPRSSCSRLPPRWSPARRRARSATYAPRSAPRSSANTTGSPRRPSPSSSRRSPAPPRPSSSTTWPLSRRSTR